MNQFDEINMSRNYTMIWKYVFEHKYARIYLLCEKCKIRNIFLQTFNHVTSFYLGSI